MRDKTVFGVNQLGDGRWAAWTCHVDDGRVVPGTFRELSVHNSAQGADEAANAARKKHLSAIQGDAQ